MSALYDEDRIVEISYVEEDRLLGISYEYADDDEAEEDEDISYNPEDDDLSYYDDVSYNLDDYNMDENGSDAEEGNDEDHIIDPKNIITDKTRRSIPQYIRNIQTSDTTPKENQAGGLSSRRQMISLTATASTESSITAPDGGFHSNSRLKNKSTMSKMVLAILLILILISLRFITKQQEQDVGLANSNGTNGEETYNSNKNQYDFADAIRNNSSLRKILKEQPNILRHSDDNGWTILLEATLAGNLDAVTMILDNIDDVAHVNRRFLPDGSGGNALWIAKQTGNKGIVNILIAHGGVEMALESDVDEAEERKQAEDERERRRTEAQELATKQAKEEVQRREEEQKEVAPITFAEAAYATEHESSWLPSILSQYPSLVYDEDANGWKLIHIASWFGNCNSVSTLITVMIDINLRSLKDKTGGNAVWLAKKANNKKIVKLLMTNGGVELKPLEKFR
jgi:ankyrin repeat protein